MASTAELKCEHLVTRGLPYRPGKRDYKLGDIGHLYRFEIGIKIKVTKST